VYSAADVFLFPTRVRATAMSCSKRELWLSAGHKGYPSHEDWVLTASTVSRPRTDDEFAAKIAELVDDQNARSRMVDGAKQLAAARYQTHCWNADEHLRISGVRSRV